MDIPFGPVSTAIRGGITASAALEVVGLKPGQVLDRLAEAVDDGEAYLVGSLASGFGNAASDVDIHVLRSGLTERQRSLLYFIEGVTVDVEHYPARWPAELLDRAAAVALARLDIGPIALDQLLTPSSWRWSARWCAAVPLRESAPNIFSDMDRRMLVPLLLRASLDQVIMLVAVARLADAAGVAESARRHLWLRAERHLLDLRCRAMGELTPGEKWLPDRARRVGLAPAAASGAEAGLRTACAELGLPPLDEWALSRVGPARGSRQVALAGRAFLINRHDRLLDTWSTCDGSLAAAVAREGATRVLTGLRRAELDLEIDNDALRKALT